MKTKALKKSWFVAARRAFVLLAVLLAAPFRLPASAEVMQLGPNFFNAGVYTVNFSTAKQNGDFWCWAACIEMVLKYHGMDVSQESMVQKVHGSLIDKGGEPLQILQALTGTGPNVAGGVSQVYAEGYTGLYQFFVQDLINGYPLIVGLNFGTEIGHAVVLTAVAFQTDMFGQYYPVSVIIRDPWPGNTDRQEIPFQTFMAGCFFSARVATVAY
ncbi:MAG: C39 family peptidase [Synergistaceae bacterium]|jgi:hypothetical protein|nr:C39 family peptidase [Synergistaceae bacterium]